ncbi:MAG: hypothetical protein COX62_04590 [Deltaproteobacteria bacterium CG_4_10_14_0_2_um_filter_43_8]|nr:MAG: hypothetical protein COV43_04545 [Deltaproteobacteria bacterium CG11_big_fil_rev_8_21_14_0_20_42_23]PJA20523.1 MAG: hypothetical protein COX62_04590 [Deltaproteobacteria bacterium CG_4_10_14_0_2_um_filter_43_8]PJC65044.1 MAG: hypothetical protein CO021_00935 [Deltaproteobacteria bacterium CG_4_9_14_0_2_um_filter_42_21]
MQSLNRVQLIGTIGIEPQTGKTKDGKAFAVLSVACANEFKLKNGKTREFVDWISVNLYGSLAYLVREKSCMGQKVFIEGPLKVSGYTLNKERQKTYYYILAHKLILLSEFPSAKKTFSDEEAVFPKAHDIEQNDEEQMQEGE